MILFALPFCVQAPYWAGPFHYDDYDHLSQVALLRQGHITFAEYLLAFHNEHFNPFWNLVFYLNWRLFGFNPFTCHLGMTFTHAASSVLLFAILLQYLRGAAAAFAAVLWSAVAIGGWDNPLAWIVVAPFSISVCFLLASMACVTPYRRGGSIGWAVAMSAFFTGSMLTMGSAIVLAPVIVAHYFLVERVREINGRARTFWFLFWLLPSVVLAVVQIPFLLSAMPDQSGVDLTSGFRLLLGGYSIAGARLFSYLEEGPTLMGLGGVFAALTIVTTALLWRRIRFRTLTVFVVMPVAFSLLAYLARSTWPALLVLTWGRYRYLPTLSWCVALGVILDACLRSNRFRYQGEIAGALASGALVYLVIVQFILAHHTAARFLGVSAQSERMRIYYTLELKKASRFGILQKKYVTVPDIPLTFWEKPHMLSQFAVYRFPKGLPYVEFRLPSNEPDNFPE